ncbi:SDR family NAD(P)-dependent oxidoreductase [Herbidospora mongoliensis]|uniref:SDR family NAD(P)-dependent oxidoreductase n=1 Tax=Herbidospora mongoliensis TaxID=688067 RepID=UPI000834A654|nr:SDR family NAD(P)-dependent oxidoreductase [Herbidospora mongoliensis]
MAVTVISGGTDGMGRALALARAARGDRVFAIGSNRAKGERLGGAVEFVHADLSTLAGNRAAIAAITAATPVVDALALFANRQAPRRTVTADGLETTFALYYLSRHLLSHGLTPLLSASARPVIVNVAGVGTTKGAIAWDDPQLTRGYGMVRAQLQAGRANDLLGVAYAAEHGERVPYVLYHPGFTRSGDASMLPPPLRLALRVAARLAARTVEASVAPVHDFIDDPPKAPLTAVDRGRPLPLTLRTLDPADAARLAELTAEIRA